MRRIEVETRIHAPIERCFDVARSVEEHLGSTSQTGERVVGGVTSGLLELGDEVTWEARHFGRRLRLTSRLTEFDRPHYFVDAQVSGPFASFRHAHEFIESGGVIIMRDVVRYAAPFGLLGDLLGRLILDAYLRAFLRTRGEHLRRAAEARIR